MKMRLCSACLLGVRCRYDGKSKPCGKVLELAKKEILIPICPEQLGGLPTPREKSEMIKGKVTTESGRDVTRNFKIGAQEALRIARLFGIKEAILHQESPSCGSGKIHDGSFSGRVIKGDGVTTELLRKNRIMVISEEEL